jgi:hypothetical protein
MRTKAESCPVLRQPSATHLIQQIYARRSYLQIPSSKAGPSVSGGRQPQSSPAYQRLSLFNLQNLFNDSPIPSSNAGTEASVTTGRRQSSRSTLSSWPQLQPARKASRASSSGNTTRQPMSRYCARQLERCTRSHGPAVTTLTTTNARRVSPDTSLVRLMVLTGIASARWYVHDVVLTALVMS